MSLDACRNSWKWGAGASLIGSSTGHGCVKRGSKRKERELSSEVAATSETAKITQHFHSLASPLKKPRSMPQDYQKTVSGGSLWPELGRSSTHYTNVVCSWRKMGHPGLTVASDISTPGGRNALPKFQLQPEDNPQDCLGTCIMSSSIF